MIARIKGLKRKKTPAKSPAAPTAAPKQQLLPVSATISFGGWQPRTAMHMEEVFTFLTSGSSQLPLSSTKLSVHHQKLDLQSVAKEAGYLEYVRATTNSGIDIRFFEDGVYLIELESKNLEQASKELRKYHTEALLPALEYLFSLEAPVPNIFQFDKLSHPTVVSLSWPYPRHFEIDPAFGAVHQQITSDEVTVYKTDSYIFIATDKRSQASLRDLIEMQIFFHEFQLCLDQFLNSQRKTWGELNNIYHRQYIKPAELPQLHRQLLKIQKSLLISQGRLGQMDAYIQNRAAVAEQLDLSDHLLLLFHFRFEALEDSYHYLVHNWEMTGNFCRQTSELLSSLQERATYAMISSQRFIIILLMVAILAGWLTTANVVSISFQQISTLIVVLIVGMVFGWLSSLYLKHSEYRIRQPIKKPSNQ